MYDDGNIVCDNLFLFLVVVDVYRPKKVSEIWTDLECHLLLFLPLSSYPPPLSFSQGNCIIDRLQSISQTDDWSFAVLLGRLEYHHTWSCSYCYNARIETSWSYIWNPTLSNCNIKTSKSKGKPLTIKMFIIVGCCWFGGWWRYPQAGWFTQYCKLVSVSACNVWWYFPSFLKQRKAEEEEEEKENL